MRFDVITVDSQRMTTTAQNHIHTSPQECADAIGDFMQSVYVKPQAADCTMYNQLQKIKRKRLSSGLSDFEPNIHTSRVFYSSLFRDGD